MKKIHFVIILSICFVFISVNQAIAQQINPKIQEVYGDQTQAILASDPERLTFLNDLIENRVKILESPISGEDKFVKLSTVSLLNKYNTDLKRDITFDPNNFNPLKYNFIVSAKLPIVYRVDNTNYIIVIQPQTLNNK